MTAVANVPRFTQPANGRPAEDEPRVVLHDVSWQSYQAIGEALTDRPALRLTYDRGSLEIMTTSPRHEVLKKWAARMVETLAEEFRKPYATAGNMTFQGESLERGLEPDDCYWIENELRMRGKLDWNALTDPPPDLMLEIEVSRGILDRMAIYALLRVAQVWRFDGQTLDVFLLQEGGTYLRSEHSPTFPGIALAEVAAFMQPDAKVDLLTRIEQFRQWIREQLGRAE